MHRLPRHRTIRVFEGFAGREGFSEMFNWIMIIKTKYNG
jgi:hypothetical protein